MFYSTSRITLIAALLCCVAYEPVHSSEHASSDTSHALIRLAADHIDAVFGDVASSTRALAAEYVSLSRSVGEPSSEERTSWRQRSQKRGTTVRFKDRDENPQKPVAFQAPQPAFYAYDGGHFDDQTFRQLTIFQQLAPLFRSAYRSFDFSWVYLTTSSNMMLLYPFLPIDEAVNNDPPLDQVFYTSANFAQRKAGWTLPYLDLVGAGMMITVSFPAYLNDTLLGVISRDITLDQLSGTVLSHLTVEDGAIAYIISQDGLVIGVSDPQLAKELDRVNSDTGAAVLHYSSRGQLEKAGLRDAQVSAHDWINEITGQLIQRTQTHPQTDLFQLRRDGHRLLAARTALTGWYLVMLLPDD